MTNQPSVSTSPAPAASRAPVIYALTIKQFRGIEAFTWRPGKGVNIILGGGDVGKTTILEAIALLLSPTNAVNISDTDYYLRNVDAGFVIEAVFSLPLETGINEQLKPSWPWEWNGNRGGCAQRRWRRRQGRAGLLPASTRHRRSRTRI
jgi:putative ATP-dependent endonuclease of OLD family